MAAVSADGHLYTWGEGVGCGFAGNQMLTRPKLVLGLENVNTVSCGNCPPAPPCNARPPRNALP